MRSASLLLAALACVIGTYAHADIINLAAIASQSDQTKSVAVNETLGAGSYTFSVVGTSTQGAAYNAYAVYQGSPGYPAWLDDFFVDAGGVTYHNHAQQPRFDTALQALAYYSPFTISLTLSQPGQVSFYLEDNGYPYFADDSGGVSVAVTRNAVVPEPASVAMLGVGLLGLTMLLRRRTRPLRPAGLEPATKPL